MTTPDLSLLLPLQLIVQLLQIDLIIILLPRRVIKADNCLVSLHTGRWTRCN